MLTPRDFLDLGSQRAVGLALMRHAKAGTIRKLARGLYDYPRTDERLGVLAASTEDIANALKGRDSVRLQVSGGHAANQLQGRDVAVEGWKLIKRFSEDIDVVIDRAFLGFGGDLSPQHARSNRQRDQRLEDLNAACQHTIKTFSSALRPPKTLGFWKVRMPCDADV